MKNFPPELVPLPLILPDRTCSVIRKGRICVVELA